MNDIKTNKLIQELSEEAYKITIICNQGQTVMAGMELVTLLEKILGNFTIFSQEQQNNLKDLILNLEKCQKNNDYYGIADYLSFEFTYILSHC